MIPAAHLHRLLVHVLRSILEDQEKTGPAKPATGNASSNGPEPTTSTCRTSPPSTASRPVRASPPTTTSSTPPRPIPDGSRPAE